MQSNASSHIEIGVIIAEVILLLGFAFPLWANRVDQFPDPNVRVNAWGEQFSWNFHYPGPDGKFGVTNRFLITGPNPIGLDKDDPNALDDIISPKLVVPKDKKIEIAVTSKDVIHNLALKTMRIAQDADPGKVSRMWFIPIRAGESEIICGQLCGASHGNMRALLEVMPDQKKYESWLKERSPVFGGAPAGVDPATGAAAPAAPGQPQIPAAAPSVPSGAPVPGSPPPPGAPVPPPAGATTPATPPAQTAPPQATPPVNPTPQGSPPQVPPTQAPPPPQAPPAEREPAQAGTPQPAPAVAPQSAAPAPPQSVPSTPAPTKP